MVTDQLLLTMLWFQDVYKNVFKNATKFLCIMYSLKNCGEEMMSYIHFYQYFDFQEYSL